MLCILIFASMFFRKNCENHMLKTICFWNFRFFDVVGGAKRRRRLKTQQQRDLDVAETNSVDVWGLRGEKTSNHPSDRPRIVRGSSAGVGGMRGAW